MFEDEYATEAEIPAGYRHLYKEAGGKFVIIKAGEIKTVEDISTIQEGLRKEREDHKETKGKLAKFGATDPETVGKDLAELAELRIKDEGKDGEDLESKANKIAEARVNAAVAPLNLQIKTLTESNETLTTSNGEYIAKDNTRVITDNVREACTESELNDGGVSDALFRAAHIFEIPEGGGDPVTRDGVGVTPGMNATLWLTEMKEKQSNWWPESVSANSQSGKLGNQSNNPFTHDNWNLTKQGEAVTSNAANAEKMATLAGTTVGGPQPAK